MASCAKCGTENADGRILCENCGADLSARPAPAPAPAPTARPPIAAPRLTGVAAGRRSELAGMLKSRRAKGTIRTRRDDEGVERAFCAAVAARTGTPEDEVLAVAREFFAQAFVMAAERGGTLVVPHFATFKCRPNDFGKVHFFFRPRTPDELAAAASARRQKLARRKPGAAGSPPWRSVPLRGERYVPTPPAPAGEARASRKSSKRGGFFSRLFGGGG
jgi:hypothetical protein